MFNIKVGSYIVKYFDSTLFHCLQIVFPNSLSIVIVTQCKGHFQRLYTYVHTYVYIHMYTLRKQNDLLQVLSTCKFIDPIKLLWNTRQSMLCVI